MQNNTINIEKMKSTLTPEYISGLIKPVLRYQTPDGQNFKTKDVAISHQKRIEEVKIADEMLRSHASIGAILCALGHEVSDDILYRITKESKLVIEHWSDRKAAIYQPQFFCNFTVIKLYVSSPVGSGHRSCGDCICIDSLVRYAQDVRSILSPITQTQ